MSEEGPLSEHELTDVEICLAGTGPDYVGVFDRWTVARMAREIRAHRQTLVNAEDLIIAARQLSDADLGRLRRSINSLVREDAVEELTTRAVALSDSQLGLLRRYVNNEFENRIRNTKSLTEDEQKLLADRKLIDCVKAVRERTGLGLADSKELVDRWRQGERS